jgi:16S rRNA (guanine527-N7)-methyltransferase
LSPTGPREPWVPDEDPLAEVLGEAQRRGFLGPGPVAESIGHSRDFAAGVGVWHGRFLDLGAGGGIPGLVLLTCWPDARGVLLDAQRRRCEFLTSATLELGVADRAAVVCGRAEELARDPEHRGAYELVVARGFGPPAVTAECAVGFLASGGRLAVSDAGHDPQRWPTAGLRELGFGVAATSTQGRARLAVVRLEQPVDHRWPRRMGVPAKRPLW